MLERCLSMRLDIFATLEERVQNLLERFDALQQENEQLRESNLALMHERQEMKTRLDDILAKLERI